MISSVQIDWLSRNDLGCFAHTWNLAELVFGVGMFTFVIDHSYGDKKDSSSSRLVVLTSPLAVGSISEELAAIFNSDLLIKAVFIVTASMILGEETQGVGIGKEILEVILVRV